MGGLDLGLLDPSARRDEGEQLRQVALVREHRVR